MKAGMRNAGAAVLGAATALGVCAAVVFGGVLGADDGGSASTKQTEQVAQTSSSNSGSGSSSSSSSAGSHDLAELYSAVKDGVVFVNAGQGTGSGFVISDDGYIVTNEHVIENASTLEVQIGETDQTVPATLVGADASTDLALLKVDPAQTGDLHVLPLADAGSVEVGDEVIAIGSPFGLQSTLTSGIVSALGRTLQSPNGQAIGDAIQTDASINPGNSGGPLLNTDGQVIGVNAQIASQSGGSTGVGFAISVETVKHIIPQLKAGGGTAQEQQQQQVDPSQQGQIDPSQGLTQEQLQQLLEQLQEQQQGGGYGQQQPSDPYADPYGQSSPYGESDPYGQGYSLPGMG